MAAKKGDGLLMVYSDVPAEKDAAFNRWYNEEHIPERLSIPGVLNAARYEAVAGGPKYLACYELATPDAWYSDVWQKWLNNPTEWSKRMAPSVIATSYIRNLYRRIYPSDVPPDTAQADMAPVLLVGRMSVPEGLDDTFNAAYNNERLPLCLSIPGYIRARRFEAVMGSPKYSTVHEMASLTVWQSREWDDWRNAVTPIWNRDIRPHMVHADGSPGVYRRIFPA
jgi:heme-degrading monooxygenase HmoA